MHKGARAAVIYKSTYGKLVIINSGMVEYVTVQPLKAILLKLTDEG